MEFVDKYLMPHKGKIALLLIVDLLVFLTYPVESVLTHKIGPNDIGMLLLTSVLGGIALVLAVSVGWHGRKHLNYKWTDTAKAGASIGVLLAIFGAIMGAISSQWMKYTPSLDLIGVIFWQVWAFAYAIVVYAVFALIGHAAAKYLGGKAAKPQPVKSAGRKRKH